VISVDLTLSAIEVRILGCLIEKQATTPDVYPMTLNALLTACNQKTNREPVMNLAEDEVLAALDSLIDKTLAALYQTSQAGRSRVAKYQHRLSQRAFDEFNFSVPELAVLAALFLRGPQTLGEIRSRCARIHEFPDLEAVNSVLGELESNPHGPYVKMLPPQPGRKEPRFSHLFCGDVDEGITTASGSPQHGSAGTGVEELSRQVEALEDRLLSLEQRFSEFVEQFE
jgi:uncharacterized protein YceH (UPF0502 family)